MNFRIVIFIEQGHTPTQLIKDPRSLSLTEIDYRIGGLKEYHHRILSYLIQGKNDDEIAQLIGVRVGSIRTRIHTACDHAGVSTRSQLVAMYTIYSCRMTIAKLNFENEINTATNDTEYGADKLCVFERIVTNYITKGFKLWTRKP